MGLFHGNIKPSKILYNNMDVTTNAETLLFVGDREDSEEAFICHYYTPGYASKEQIEAVNNK